MDYPEVTKLLSLRGLECELIYAGLTGSCAYGLRDVLAVVSTGEASLGLFPTEVLVTLPGEDVEDVFLYEIRKFVELIKEGNPFAQEALLHDEGTCTPEFGQLRRLRNHLANKTTARAYLGYVVTQLDIHAKNPLPGKRLYHSARLLNSIEDLLQGRLPRVSVPEHQVENLLEIKMGRIEPAEYVPSLLERATAFRDRIEASSLPEDSGEIFDKWLLNFRYLEFTKSSGSEKN